MKRYTKRIAILLAAPIFIAMGVVGLFLPFLQGVLFIAIGLMLVSILSPSVRGWMDKHTVRYPKLHRIIGKVDSWMRKTIGDV